MNIHSIDWDEDTIAHIARHGVDQREVEDVCFTGHPLILRTRHNRYAALGQTRGGRCLTVIFEYHGQNKATVVTARAMSQSERRLYQRR